MSKKKDDIGREVKQLWRIANFYFCEATSLKKNTNFPSDFLSQKISEIADNQIGANIDEQPTSEMKFSAHLGSCAIRLATIEERLYKAGKESNRNRIYEALRKLNSVSQATLERNNSNANLFHFLFRNIVAHIEPHGEGKKAYQDMEIFFKSQNHEQVYSYIHDALKEIKIEIENHFCKVKP